MSARQPVDMRGRVCVVTGASSGIGRATARGLAEMGADVVLVCRDATRGEQTLSEIRRSARGGSLDLVLADLSSQVQVRKAAAQLLAKERPLHVLINNAGTLNLRRETTADGVEATFAINHLACFLLTLLLLDRLKESAPSRIVNVASVMHRFGDLAFNDASGQSRYRARRVYGRSKLANVLFTYELARRLEGTDVTVNCADPGAVATRILDDNGLLPRIAMTLGRFLLRTPEQGADTSLWLASAPELEGVSGRYFARRREKRTSNASYDLEAARALWKLSERMTGLKA